MNWKSILAEAALLMFAASLLGAGANSLRADAHKLAWSLRIAPPPKELGLNYLEIPSDVALRLHRAGVLFVDARRSSAYQEGHIEKAVNIPVWENGVEERISALVSRGLKPDTPLVVYCSGGTCEDAVLLAGKLALANFYNIYLYKEGYPDWLGKNRPITRGKMP